MWIKLYYCEACQQRMPRDIYKPWHDKSGGGGSSSSGGGGGGASSCGSGSSTEAGPSSAGDVEMA